MGIIRRKSLLIAFYKKENVKRNWEIKDITSRERNPQERKEKGKIVMKELSLEQKEKIGRIFCKMPSQEITLEICEIAISQDGKNIRYVPKRFLSEELIKKAIEQDLDAFFVLKKEQMSEGVLKSCFEKAKDNNESHRFIENVEKKFKRFKELDWKTLINKDVALAMVSFDGNYFSKLPDAYRKDMDIIKVAIKTFGDIISILKEEEITRDIVLLAIKGNVGMHHIPEQFLDDEILTLLVKRNYNNFLNLPSECQTYELCLEAVRSGLEYDDIPKEYYSQEIFNALVEGDASYLRYVPKQYLTQDMILSAVKDMVTVGNFLEPEFVDEELAYQLVCLGVPLYFECIRANETQRIVNKAVELDPMQVAHVNNAQYLTREIIIKGFEARTDIFFSLPEEVIDEEICYLAVCNGFRSIGDFRFSRFQSQRIIDELVKEKAFSLKEIGYSAMSTLRAVKQEYLDTEFFKKVLPDNPYALKVAPKEVLSEELVYLAVSSGLRRREDYLVDFQSQRIIDKFFEEKVTLLSWIKEEFMTEEILKKAVMYSSKNANQIPENLLTEELCYLHVSCGFTLADIETKKYLSERIVKRAIQNDINEYVYLPSEFKTKELSLDVLKKDGTLLPFVPCEFTTADMWVDAIGEGVIRKERIDTIPTPFMTDETLTKLIKHDWESIKYIPKQYLTAEVCMTALEQNESAIEYFNL